MGKSDFVAVTAIALLIITLIYAALESTEVHTTTTITSSFTTTTTIALSTVSPQKACDLQNIIVAQERTTVSSSQPTYSIYCSNGPFYWCEEGNVEGLVIGQDYKITIGSWVDYEWLSGYCTFTLVSVNA